MKKLSFLAIILMSSISVFAQKNAPKITNAELRLQKKIENDILLQNVVSFVLYRAALHFVNEKEIETAEELAPQIKETLRRAVVKIAVAQALLQLKTDKNIDKSQIDFEKQRAFALLSDVQRDLQNADASLNTVKTLFGVTAVLAKFDKTQALNSLEQTVQMINKLDKLNVKESSAPKLGIDFSKVTSATVDTPLIGFGFKNAIENLIETDFEQIASIVERLTIKKFAVSDASKRRGYFFRKINSGARTARPPMPAKRSVATPAVKDSI